jgi:alcohol dehydrogenase
MKEFNLLFPQKIFFGNNSVEKLKDIDLNEKKCLLIIGSKFLKQTGVLNKIIKILEDKKNKVFIFSGVEPEVSVETVDRAADFARNKNVECVIGIGGGSVLDCAKAVNGIYKQKYSVKDYLDGKVKVNNTGIFIAIPTTAGTGSEVTKNAVLTYTEKEKKISLRSELLVAKIAVLDPFLTISMPQNITAYTGMDALSHAVESYFSINANDFTKGLAEKSIVLILNNLYKAYKNGNDINARYNLLYASLLAGFSFANAGLGAVHGIGHPIGAICKIPHGLVNAVLLPYVLEFNKPKIKNDLKKLEKNIGCKLIDKIKNLNEKMKIPDKINEIDSNFKMKIDHIILRTDYSGSMAYNPVKMNEEKVRRILESI